MPWSHPAARMREFILALRAIWGCWYKGEKLDFRGEFYTHTLMTPMFTPTEKRFGHPRVFLAAVGPKMTEVAGEVADGVLCHAFTTERYMREVTIPAVERGLAKAGRRREEFTVTCPIFVVTGADEEAFLASRAANAKQIAFYGSTPAYRPVLEMAGRAGLQGDLHRLSKRGRWDEMAELIDDDLLGQFAVVGQPGEVARGLKDRSRNLLDRLILTVSLPDREQRAELVRELHAED